MFEFLSLVVASVKANTNITDEIPESNIYEYNHPTKNTKYPLMVLTVDEEEFETTDLSNSCLYLEIHVLTRQNTTNQLSKVVKELKDSLSNASFNDAVNSVNYICQFEGVSQIDTSELNVAPAPVGAAVRFKVLSGMEV